MIVQICKNCEHKHERCYRPPNSTCGKFKPENMTYKKSWEEFRESGMLWWINMMLHTFGWAIVVDIDDGNISNVCPARVKFRGFEEKNNTDGYIRVSQYLKDNSSELLTEAKD